MAESSLFLSPCMNRCKRDIFSVSAAQSKCTWALSLPVLRHARKVLQSFTTVFDCRRGMPPFLKSCWSCVILLVFPVAWYCALWSTLSGVWPRFPSGPGYNGLDQRHRNCFLFFNSSCRHICQYFSLYFFSPRHSKGWGHALCGIIYGSNVSNSLLISVPFFWRLL